MIEVKNLLFQPLTFHLRDGKESLHLGPRQRRLIESEAVSSELEQGARRKFVALTQVKEQSSAVSEERSEPATKPARKRRQHA